MTDALCTAFGTTSPCGPPRRSIGSPLPVIPTYDLGGPMSPGSRARPNYKSPA